jgi:spore maturation protein CgeB
MKLKEIAGNFKFLFWVNSKIRSYQLKWGLARLAGDYNAKALAKNFVYDASEAVLEFKRRHKLYQPNFSARVPGDLRVFWVGTSQSQDESGFLQSLQRICTVTTFSDIDGEYGIWSGNKSAINVPSFDEVRETNAQLLLSQVTRTMEEGGLDLLLGQMWGRLIPKETLKKIQSMGIPVINISMDDRLPDLWSHRHGVHLGSVGLASGIDMMLTTSPETCSWFGVENCPALFWPLASDPDVYAPVLGEFRDIDVLFIGNKYGIRGQIIRFLERRGLNVDCYGDGWPNGHIDAKKMASLSKRARIILGVGTVGHCADVYTLKLRDFDALMAGALYLTHRNPDLCQLFKEGEEIEFYESPAEAYRKICKYIGSADERIRIGQNGQQKAILKHTWDKRLTTTFRQLGLIQ